MSDKELLIPASQMDASAINARTRRGRIQMLLLLLACASPVIASYFAYYVIKPEGGKTNFGTLVYPAQEFNGAWLDAPLQGKWTLLIARPAGECQIKDEKCVEALFLMRQTRVAMGRERAKVCNAQSCFVLGVGCYCHSICRATISLSLYQTGV